MTWMQMLWLLMIAAACRPREVPVLAHRPVEESSTAIISTTRMDYRQPMIPRDRSIVIQAADRAYLTRCRAGDIGACFHVVELEDQAIPYIKENCARGDRLSCRFMKYKTRNLVWLQTSTEEMREGCEAGILNDCTGLGVDGDRDGLMRVCEATRFVFCFVAGKALLAEPREPQRARDMLELGCQSNEVCACGLLVKGYRQGEFSEPIPGRARELEAHLREQYTCPRKP